MFPKDRKIKTYQTVEDNDCPVSYTHLYYTLHSPDILYLLLYGFLLDKNELISPSKKAESTVSLKTGNCLLYTSRCV